MTSRFQIILSVLATTAILSAPAQARYTAPVDIAAIPAYPTEQVHRTAYRPSRAASRSAERRRTPHTSREAGLARPEPRQGEMGGRSGSCLRFAATRYLWCGCGAADEVGLDNSDGHWNLAANYFELPRAEPGFNMVAVRYGHVAVLKSHVSGSIWVAFDPNSGGHRAHTHEIDLRHFRAVVDPHGSPVKRLAVYRHHPRHHRIRLAHR